MSASRPFADAGFAELKTYVIEHTGLIYFNDKDEDLRARLQRRLDATSSSTYQSYLDLLRSPEAGPPEFDRMATELTIGETYFFRHREQFDALRSTVIPDLIVRNRLTRRLRIWCAGCSIGAEPYSIAILLAEEFKHELAGWDVRIVGTDLNRDFLARAEEGRFDEWAFRMTQPSLREKHFQHVGKSWEIAPEIKRVVEFRWHNLITAVAAPLVTGGGPFDLIVCRNVMIYFDWATVARIMPTFEDGLGEGGWMIIGHAEQAHGATKLNLIQLPAVTIYQKTTYAPMVLAEPVPLPRPPAAATVAVTSRPSTSEADIALLRRLADAGEFDQALALCSKLVAASGRDARLYFYRALILEQAARAAEIVGDLERAVEIDHSFVMAHYCLALHHRRSRDQRRAGRSFNSALFLLENLPDQHVVPEADEMTVGQLKTIIKRYLEAA